MALPVGRIDAGVGNGIPYVDVKLAVLFMLIGFANNIRIPCLTMINAAGHFKETQWRAILEAVINITVSILLIKPLPTQFVLKCTHDSGGLVVCKDKNNLNKKAAKKKIENSMKTNYYKGGREWPYKNVKPQIIAEEYMEDISGNGLTDYKFYCFNGDPKYLYVSNGMDNHETARLSFLTMNWEKAPFGRSDYLEFEVLPPKPAKFDEMVKIAKSLSSGHPFLRVDLYEINNKVYFSELTFSPCGGFMPFVPEEWDAKLGEMVNIRKVK